MINYIEKGIGLHDAIIKAGYSLYQHNGFWVADDEEAVQAIIDAYVEPSEGEGEYAIRLMTEKFVGIGIDPDKAAQLAKVLEVL